MSERFPGGFVTMTPPTVSKDSAPGVWTVDQALQNQQAGVWPFGGPFNYIEDVFSTYLHTGNDTARSIQNGINLSGNGGLVWIKGRSTASNNILVSEPPFFTVSNTTAARVSDSTRVSSFNADGFSIGVDGAVNNNNSTFVSWTFRKQAKFFDVVTYTGTGVARTVAHNLGSVPGCVIVKRTDTTGQWAVYHRSQTSAAYYTFLNATSAEATSSGVWNSTAPTATEFSVGTNANTNASGGAYVAYIFAHNAGGFGLLGTDNVISCGSYTGAAATVTVDLGWEPQFVLLKRANGIGNWVVLDNMRGVGPIDATNTTVANVLYPNTSGTEANAGSSNFGISATGFSVGSGWGDGNAAAGATYIYIAIRRGPMKRPTSGTSVFNAVSRTGTGATETITGPSFPPDFVQVASRSLANGFLFASRLQGNGQQMLPSNANAEGTNTAAITTINQNGITVGTGSFVNTSGQTYINYFLGRAPSFMDVVCYSGTGVARTVNHNLTVAPEFIIVKKRTSAINSNWAVYHSALGNSNFILLSSAGSSASSSVYWNNTSPTSSVFTVGTSAVTNNSGDNYVSYLFASCPGVSKVGSYTGTGTTLQINCGFTAGARLVLIKRTDTTGDWYVWDSARGIVAGNDPYLLMNDTIAEVTGTDYIDPYSAGFEISSTAPAAINASGGTYIYLAIA